MTVKLTDKVYNEGGSPVQGAVAQAILTNGVTAGSVVATDLTDTKGVWAFDGSISGHQPDLADPAAGYWYDVRINAGMQYRLRYGAIKAMMSMVYLAQSIVLGSTQLFDASLAAMKLPARTSDPPSPAAGQVVIRTDTKSFRYYDGTTWFDAGSGSSVTTGVNYTVAGGVGTVFCTAGVTVTFPQASLTFTAITVVNVSPGQTTVTLASAGGSTFSGGSVNQTSGYVMDGSVQTGDALTYRAYGNVWKAV